MVRSNENEEIELVLIDFSEIKYQCKKALYLKNVSLRGNL